MNLKFAQKFSQEWVNAWNSHDLERILEHYSDSFTIESPLALMRFPESEGTLKGKENVRKYWRLGLDKNPDLNFQILDVLIGVNGLSIYYKNTSTHKRVVENMFFDQEMKVEKAVVNYSE